MSDGLTVPASTPAPDDFATEQCPHCPELIPRNRADEHVATALNALDRLANAYADLARLTQPTPLRPRTRVVAGPPCGCCTHIWRDGKPGSGIAVARWVHSPSGNVTHLCQGCLDGWFDNADDDPSLEPAAWSWLPDRRLSFSHRQMPATKEMP